MSVKKMGKAILNDRYDRLSYRLEDSNNEYSSDELTYLQIPEFQAVLKKAYKKARNEFRAKIEAILPKVLERLQREASNRPLRLYLTDSLGREKGDLLYCNYKENLYKLDRVAYSDEEILLQIMNVEDGERKKFERLKHKFTVAEQEEKRGKRPAIPEEVRIAVWRRDEGRCVKCNSRERLEYDHIIPVSKGGSNTVRNIELLCEKCNREKKDKIE